MYNVQCKMLGIFHNHNIVLKISKRLTFKFSFSILRKCKLEQFLTDLIIKNKNIN